MLYLRQAVKLGVCILVIVVLLGFSEAMEVKVWPANIEVNSLVGEKKCVPIYFNLSKGEVFVNDKWSDNFYQDIEEYNFSSEDYGIESEYPTSLLYGDGKFNFCLTGRNPGDYYGIINLNLDSKVNVVLRIHTYFEGSSRLTGFSIFDSELKTKDIIYYEGIFVFFLLILLLFLLRLNGRLTNN
jgi:hypothetical protein